MSTYEIKTVTVTTTSQVVVAADSDVDRRVHIISGGINSVNWSFDGSSGAVIALQPETRPTAFVLPADESLYAWISSGNPAVVGLIVTKA